MDELLVIVLQFRNCNESPPTHSQTFSAEIDRIDVRHLSSLNGATPRIANGAVHDTPLIFDRFRRKRSQGSDCRRIATFVLEASGVMSMKRRRHT